MLPWLGLQICEAFGANRYPFPEESSRQRQMNAEVTARLRELQTTIEAGTPAAWQPQLLCDVQDASCGTLSLYWLQTCMGACMCDGQARMQ